jgi:hypothetical protein
MIRTDSSLLFKVAEAEEVVSDVGGCLAKKPLITEMESRISPELIATFKTTLGSIARLKIASHVSPIDAFNFLSSESLQWLNIDILLACRYPSHDHRVFCTMT